MSQGKPIPIASAKRIAKDYDYDQVVIYARAVGSHDWMTTYGRTKVHCGIAARIGQWMRKRMAEMDGAAG